MFNRPRPNKLPVYEHTFRNKNLPERVARVADLTFDGVLKNPDTSFPTGSEAPSSFYARKAMEAANRLGIALSETELSAAGLEARRQYRIHSDTH